MPDISVIICTHNRADLLGQCINSMYAQSLDPDRYEVIVVDNGSTDHTRDICRQYSGQSNFVYISEPVLGLSQARNTGWKVAKGIYIGYIDDDATAAPRWLELALYCFKNIDPQPEWVGGAVSLDWEIDPPTWMTDDYENTLGRIYWGEQPRFLTGRGERLGGLNSFFRRDVLEELGGFDVQLGRIGKSLLSAEETQLQHRITATGGHLFYHPEVSVKHFVPKERIDSRWFYRRFYWGGRSDILMEKTLRSVPHEKLVAELPDDSLPIRLIWNMLKSFGLTSSKDDIIRSRIYMAYVIGRVHGMLKTFF